MKYFTNGIYAIGMFSGIALIVCFEFFTDFFGVALEPNAGLMGTILGAAIALGGTLLTIMVGREESEERLKREDQALASEVFVKFQLMVNNLFHLREHLRSSYAGVSEKSHENPGLFVVSLATHPLPVVFSIQEKAFFIRMKDLDLANDTAEWDGIHNSIIGAFEKYADIREDLMRSTPAKMSGTLGTTTVGEEEFLRLGPRIAQLNDLEKQLRVLTERNYPDCCAAFERAREYTELKCGIKLKFELPK